MHTFNSWLVQVAVRSDLLFLLGYKWIKFIFLLALYRFWLNTRLMSTTLIQVEKTGYYLLIIIIPKFIYDCYIWILHVIHGVVIVIVHLINVITDWKRTFWNLPVISHKNKDFAGVLFVRFSALGQPFHKKKFQQMVKPAGHNHSQSQSICPV